MLTVLQELHARAGVVVLAAAVLDEIATLLELTGENPFKIRAYRNGADIVSNHPHALGTLDEHDRAVLRRILRR